MLQNCVFFYISLFRALKVALLRLHSHSSETRFHLQPATKWQRGAILIVVYRGSVRSTRGLGLTMTARGQSIGISIGMLPQTLIMSITVQKTSKYYTTEFDLEEGF